MLEKRNERWRDGTKKKKEREILLNEALSNHIATHGDVSAPACHVISSWSHDTHLLSTANMAEAEAGKALSGLMNGIAQRVYYGNSEMTEELLKDELYPEVSQEEFRALYDKMRGLLKV